MPSGLSSRRLKRPLLQQAGSKPLNELRARVHPGRVITRCPFALLIAEFLRHVWCWHSRKSKSSSSPGTYRPAHPHPNTAPTPQSHGTQQNSAAWPASQQDHSKPSRTQKVSISGGIWGFLRAVLCSLHSHCFRSGVEDQETQPLLEKPKAPGETEMLGSVSARPADPHTVPPVPAVPQLQQPSSAQHGQQHPPQPRRVPHAASDHVCGDNLSPHFCHCPCYTPAASQHRRAPGQGTEAAVTAVLRPGELSL